MADQEIKITAGPSKDMLIGGVFFGVHDHYTFVLEGESAEVTLRMIGPGDSKRETFEIKFSVYATGRWYEGWYNIRTRKGEVKLLPQRTVWYFAFKGHLSSSTVLIADADGIARYKWGSRTFEFIVDAADPVEGPDGMHARVFSSEAAQGKARGEHIVDTG